MKLLALASFKKLGWKTVSHSEVFHIFLSIQLDQPFVQQSNKKKLHYNLARCVCLIYNFSEIKIVHNACVQVPTL